VGAAVVVFVALAVALKAGGGKSTRLMPWITPAGGGGGGQGPRVGLLQAVVVVEVAPVTACGLALIFLCSAWEGRMGPAGTTEEQQRCSACRG
jgi:hypothetical protein